jgi:hypothetical protein
LYQGTAKKGYSYAPRLGVETGDTFHYTLDVKQVSGKDTDYYGLAFHTTTSPSKYYMFAVNDAHYFLIERLISPDWVTLVGRKSNASTRAGEVNRIAVRGEGSHYTFFVNDQYQGEADDKELTGGAAAIFVQVDTGDTINLEFGNYEVRAP